MTKLFPSKCPIGTTDHEQHHFRIGHQPAAGGHRTSRNGDFMKQVTIENVKARIAQIEKNQDGMKEYGFDISVQAGFELACLRKLVVSLEAEPVAEAYQPPNFGICAALGVSVRMLKPLRDGDKLYAAPPAPVSVPDERYQHLNELYHAQEKRLFKLAQRIKGRAFDKYSHSPSQAIDVLEAAIFGEDEDSCRAAMQGKAEPATDNTAQQFEALGRDTEHRHAELSTSAGSGKQCDNCGGTGEGSKHTGGECPQCLGSTKLDARRRRNRQANARARAKETPEQANQRRAANRDRMRAARGGKQ